MDVVYSYFTRLARQLILVTLVKVYSPYSMLGIHLGGFSLCACDWSWKTITFSGFCIS